MMKDPRNWENRFRAGRKERKKIERFLFIFLQICTAIHSDIYGFYFIIDFRVFFPRLPRGGGGSKRGF